MKASAEHSRAGRTWVSEGQPGDTISVKVDATQHKEQHRGGDSDCQNPFAAVGPEQQASKSKARGHDSDPRNQDVPDREVKNDR